VRELPPIQPWTKDERERFVLDRFCWAKRDLIGRPVVVKSRPDPPDAVLDVGGEIRLLEITGVVERNGLFDTQAVVSRLERCATNVFRRRNLALSAIVSMKQEPRRKKREARDSMRRVVPKGNREERRVAEAIGELAERAVQLLNNRSSLKVVRFKAEGELGLHPVYQYFDASGVPVLARYVRSVIFRSCPSHCPDVTIDRARFTALDQDQLRKIITKKIQRADTYRDLQGRMYPDAPLDLAIHDFSGLHSRIPEDHVELAVAVIRDLMKSNTAAFDQAWLLLTQEGPAGAPVLLDCN